MSANKLKILFLSHYFYPKIGGVEKHVYKISKELIKQNHQVTIITSQHDQQLKEKQTLNGIKIIRINLSKNNWVKPNKIQLWNWILKNKHLFKNADIVHCHDVFFWYLPLKLLFPRKPVFTTFHGYEGVYPPFPKAIIIRKIFEKLSHGNICIGKFIEKWYQTKATKIIYGATEIPKTLTSPKTKNSALFLGRLTSDTGILEYFQAIKILNNKNIKLKVKFCGDGPLKNQAKKYGKVLGFQKNISTHLNQNHFAFISGYLAIAEALAHKRLVFATYNNPLKKDYLYLSPFAPYINICSSPQKLAEKIQYYLQHPKKETKKVTQAYNWIKTQNWNKTTQQYLDLWQSKNLFKKIKMNYSKTYL